MKSELKLMGTIITIEIKAENAEHVMDETIQKLVDYELRFSANSDTSQLAKIAKFAGKKAVSVDADIFELIAYGKKKSLERGYLNIAIGPLIKLWNVGFSNETIPNKNDIEKKLRLTDPNCIILKKEEQTVFLEKEGMQLDLGSLAKGYFADQIIAFWKEKGVNDGSINLGGNVLVYGSKNYNVGIQNPFLPRGQYVEIVQLNNQSCVTSGIYERQFKHDGKIFHHIFDTRTGMPIDNDVASITVVADNSLTCECLTTQLFGYSAIDIIKMMKARTDIKIIVITKDKKMVKNYK